MNLYDKLCIALVSCLPKRLIYHCAMQVAIEHTARAPTVELLNLYALDALRSYEKEYGLDTTTKR